MRGDAREHLADLDAGTLVPIGLNSPRISVGASVLMSHMSWCGGPPPRKMLMTALWPVRGSESCLFAASARRMSASVNERRAERERADLQEVPAADAVAEPHAAEGNVEHERDAPMEWGEVGGIQLAGAGVMYTPTNIGRILLFSALSNRKGA